MNQKDLKKKNDMLAKISALKASINALELTNDKQYNKLLKSNKEILDKIETEYKAFMEKIEVDRLAEIKRKQAESQKILKEEIAFVSKYLAHLGKLKLGDEPDPEMFARFNNIKRKAHVIHHLRKLNLKAI